MRTDLLDHFDLDHAPFRKSIDDDRLWLPPSKETLVETITGGLRAQENIGSSGSRLVGMRYNCGKLGQK